MNHPLNLDNKNEIGLITLSTYNEIGKNFGLFNNSIWVGDSSRSNIMFDLK